MKSEPKKKIVVVDSDENDRKELTRILKKKYHVTAVGGIDAAMKVLEEQQDEISAVVIDLIVTQSDGCCLLKDILNNEALKNIPTIVTTNSGDKEKKRLALQGGAWDFISKPYDEEITLFRVKNTIALFGRVRCDDGHL